MLLIVVIEAIQARRQYRNNERSSCHNNGGSCEPMFGCILKQGYMSGSCAGFLQVCCIQPTFVSRRFKDNFIFDAGPPVSYFKEMVVRPSLKTCEKFHQFPITFRFMQQAKVNRVIARKIIGILRIVSVL